VNNSVAVEPIAKLLCSTSTTWPFDDFVVTVNNSEAVESNSEAIESESEPYRYDEVVEFNSEAVGRSRRIMRA
jgi:hypothetical protein